MKTQRLEGGFSLVIRGVCKEQMIADKNKKSCEVIANNCHGANCKGYCGSHI